ncbi:uncharacterized protein PAC_10120 [Phialocephala subalpina]|uniref:Uncharacterized protein n=1 Tax=Phialocephala subalpina TaxID=576137 RepID=A0A1L7X5C7_9HELO|nr:uncharacterized protein PAC_10120 [Phialocephala subalpina]
MLLFLRTSIAILACSVLTSADSTPFTITASSTNSTLNGMHAYINDPANEFDAVLLFTSDPTIAPTNFTLDNSGGHLLAHTPYTPLPLLEANTNNDAYDETVLFSSPAYVALGQNPPLCHEYSNYISCVVTSEGMTRLSKLYVCPAGIGYDTFRDGGALKIGNAVPTGCLAVQLNFTNCVGQC